MLLLKRSLVHRTIAAKHLLEKKAMNYRLGDIAEILRISPEMIRYYEKQGLIHPKRSNDNNYRYYSIQDLFILMEV